MMRRITLASAASLVFACSSTTTNNTYVVDDGAPCVDLDGAVAADSTIDTGTPATDTGSAPDDTGSPAVDTGVPPTSDTGTPLVDTGTAPVDTGAPPADTGPGCAIKPGGDNCTTVPKFTFSGTQIVDGVGDEFCDVASTLLTIKTGVRPPSTPASSLPGKLNARVAWSNKGLHAHLHIDDPHLIVSPSVPLTVGANDSVTMYVSGTTPLYGTFAPGAGNDHGTFSILMVPPAPTTGGLEGVTGTMPATATLTYQGKYPGGGTSIARMNPPLLAPAQFAGRIVAGGYEFELFLPWAMLGRATPPTSGDSIAIDFLLNELDDPAAETFPFYPTDYVQQSFAYQAIKSVASSCGYPDCDDRTWCTPTLE